MELEESFIGELDLDLGNEILDEQKLGDVNLKSKLGTCGIYVYNNEGQIPHFHIKTKDKKWECCIEIYRPLYFYHGTKQGKLNNKQCELLNEWLKKKVFPFDITNWENISLSWDNSENPSTNVPNNRIKPNYLLLNK
jgi:hypothetical protein